MGKHVLPDDDQKPEFNIPAILVIILIVFIFAIGQCNGESVTFSWDANPEPDVTEYELTVVEVFGTKSYVSTVTRCSYTITGLSFNTPYIATVKAINSAGAKSIASACVTFTIPSVTVPVFGTKDLINWYQVGEIKVAKKDSEFFKCGIPIQNP